MLIDLRAHCEEDPGQKEENAPPGNACRQLGSAWRAQSAQPEDPEAHEEDHVDELVDSDHRLRLGNASGWDGHRHDDSDRPERSEQAVVDGSHR